MRFSSIGVFPLAYLLAGKAKANVAITDEVDGSDVLLKRGAVHAVQNKKQKGLNQKEGMHWGRYLDGGAKSPKASKKSKKSSPPSYAPTMLTCDPTDIHGLWAGSGLAVNKEAVEDNGGSVDLYSIWCAAPLGNSCDGTCDSPSPLDPTDPGIEFRVCNYSCEAGYKSKAYMAGMYSPDLFDNKCVLSMVEDGGAGFYRAVTCPETGSIKYQVTQVSDTVKVDYRRRLEKSYPFALAQNEIMRLANSCDWETFDCPDCCYNSTLPGCPDAP